MDLKQLTDRAKEVHEKYSELNKKNIGREWTRSEIAQGFAGDVGDLMKLVMANEGVRAIDDAEKKLKHEISDCLWSILILADKYEIDLEREFLSTMDDLDKRFEE